MVVQHFWPDKLQAGRYLLGVQTKASKQVDLATLDLFPAQEQESIGGSWRLTDCQDGRIRNFLRYVSARLGPHPVRFAKPFVQALRDSRPIGLISDTNALYSGALPQALSLRINRPTFVGIPDQVFMEMQKLRESSPVSAEMSATAANDIEIWARELSQRKHRVVLPRVIQRLHSSGFLIHHIEPPEAKVRYFGGNRGSIDGNERLFEDHEADDTIVGADFVRDRLVLEAVRAARSSLDGLQIWLVTSDKNFAHQAQLENFAVGYAEPLPIEPSWSIASPWVNPYTLDFQHLPIEHFLEEILYLCESLTLQRENSTQRQLFTLTSNTHKKRIWMDLGEDALLPQVCSNREVPYWPAPAASSSTTALQASQRPAVQENFVLTMPEQQILQPIPKLNMDIAAAECFVGALVRASTGVVTVTKKTSNARQLLSVFSYLVSLGWVELQLAGKERRRFIATEKGQELARRWVGFRADLADHIPGWASWLSEVADAVATRTPHAKILEAIPASGGLTYRELATKLNYSESTIRKQVALGQYLGTMIRMHENKEMRVWRSRAATAEQAAQWMLTLLNDGIRIDRLFLNLLNTTPLGVPSFRLGLLTLLRQGHVRFGGSLPDTTRSDGRAVRVGVLVPNPSGAESRELDLGAGDFLIPGQPCQAMLPREAR